MTYSDKLKDRRWQRKILDVKQFFGNQCQCCFDRDAYMQVHHKVYYPNTEPWDYEIKDLTLVCPVCHEWIESMKKNEFMVELSGILNWTITDICFLIERLKKIDSKQAITIIESQIITLEDL